MVTGPLNHSEHPTGTKSCSGVPCSSTRTTRGYPNFLLVQGSQLEMHPTDNIQSMITLHPVNTNLQSSDHINPPSSTLKASQS